MVADSAAPVLVMTAGLFTVESDVMLMVRTPLVAIETDKPLMVVSFGLLQLIKPVAGLRCSVVVGTGSLRAPSPDPWRSARGGLFCGAALLMSPNILPVLVGFGAIAAWKLRANPR